MNWLHRRMLRESGFEHFNVVRILLITLVQTLGGILFQLRDFFLFKSLLLWLVYWRRISLSYVDYLEILVVVVVWIFLGCFGQMLVWRLALSCDIRFQMERHWVLDFVTLVLCLMGSGGLLLSFLIFLNKFGLLVFLVDLFIELSLDFSWMLLLLLFFFLMFIEILFYFEFHRFNWTDTALIQLRLFSILYQCFRLLGSIIYHHQISMWSGLSQWRYRVISNIRLAIFSFLLPSPCFHLVP